MTNYIPTINNQIQILTTGLIGVETGITSMDILKKNSIALGVDNTADSYYQLAYVNNTSPQVAALIVQNVGITGSLVPEAISFLTSILNSTLPNQRGEVIFHILENFLGLTSDPILGAAATKYLDIVMAAASYNGLLDAPNGYVLPNVIGLDSTAAAKIAAFQGATIAEAILIAAQTKQLEDYKSEALITGKQITKLNEAATDQSNLLKTQTKQLEDYKSEASITEGQIAALNASLNIIAATGATTTVDGTGTLLNSVLNTSDSSINILNNSPGSVFSGISTLNDNSLTSLIFSGIGLTGISSSLLDTQSVLTISNVNTNPLGVLINNVAAPNLSNLYIAGTGNTTITTLNDSAVAIAITNTGSGNFAISNFNAPRATTQTFTNSGSGKMDIGSVTHSNTDLVTLTFLGNVSDSVTSSVLSSVIGSTNHSDVNINLTHTTAISANIHLGNGNNTIKDFGTTTVTDSFFLGSGNNLIDANSMTTGNIAATIGDGNNKILANGLTTGNLTVSAGNGNNLISANTLTTGNILITAGNGNQSITANAMTTGNMTVTLGNGNNNISSNTLTTGNLTVVAGSGNNSISATAMTSGILKASLGNGLNNLILSSGGQTGVDVITHTAPNGGNTNALFSITNWYNAGIADTLKFAVAGVSNSVTNGGSVVSISAGIANANLSSGLNIFNTGGNTYFYEYTGNPLTSDLICIVGSITATATISSQTITGNHS